MALRTRAIFALLAASALTTVCIPSRVMAEARAADADTTAPPESTLAEIVVTANKREQTISNVGMSITAATGDQLTARGISNVSDLTKVVPGLTVQESAFNSVSYTLRGIGFFNSDLASPPAVSVYVDEVPVAYPAMSRLIALDLERVEVLKGPQGTLFGQNSTGGAINYIAAKPTDAFKAGLNASYGRFNEFDTDGFISGPIAQGISARFAFKTAFADAWQQSYTRDDTLGAKNQLSGRLSLAIEPTSRLHISLVAAGWRDHSQSPGAQLIGIHPSIPSQLSPALTAYPLAPADNRAADWTPGLNYAHRDTFYQLSGRVRYDLSDDVYLTSLTSYERYKQQYDQDSDGTDLSLFNIFDARGHISTFSQEVRLNANIGRTKLLFGANYEKDSLFDSAHESYRDTSASKAFEPLTQALQSAAYGDYKIKDYAFFGGLNYELTPNLEAAVSGRYNNNSVRYSGCAYDTDGSAAGTLNVFYALIHGQPFPTTVPTTPFQPGDCYVLDNQNGYTPAGVIHKELKQDNFSWRAELNWKVSSATLLYANISKGYKAGTVPVTAASLTQQYTPVPQESVLAYETGFKTHMLNRAVQLTGALFYYDYSDKQLRGKIIDPLFGQLESLVTIPKSRVWGAEVGATIRPFKGLTISPGITYVNSKVQKFVGINSIGVLGDYAGTPFPYSPEWQIVTDAQYDFPVGDNLNGFVGADVTYNSRTNAGVGAPALLVIDPYSIVDLRAGVETQDGRYRISVWGRNVFNTYYWTNDFLGLDSVARFAGRPATYGVTVGYRF